MERRNNGIDFHAHILPGADHGSGSVEESAKQLSILHNAGIGKVVATPHFYPNEMCIEDFLSRRERAVDDIKSVLKEETPLIYPAAEVLLCQGLEKMQGIEKLCIIGTNCILLEHPFYGVDEDIIATVVNIRKMGLYPVMVHIDRYDQQVADMVFRAGVQCQINVDSLKHIFKRGNILKYVKCGNICAIGTDIHKTDEECGKNYEKAGKILKDYFDSIMQRSEKILEKAIPIIK